MSDARAVMSVAIADIAIGERIGFYHDDHAASLAAALAIEGQNDPIHLRRNGNAAKKKWTLIAGRHRIGAASMLAWTHIDAIQIADASAGPAQLLRLELSENLDHRNPKPLERAIFIAARARTEEQQEHGSFADERPQDRANRLRWERRNNAEADTSAIVADASSNETRAAESDTSITMMDVSFNESRAVESDPSATMADGSNWKIRTAASCGISVRAVERYLRLHAAIITPFIPILDGRESAHPYAERLNSHRLGESLTAMTRIAQIETIEGRRAVIEAILADPDLATIDAALTAAKISTSKGSRANAAAAPFNSFISAYHRMPAPERKAVALQFAEGVAPEIAKSMMAAFIKRGIAL